MAFVSSGYNPEKPMEGRISDIGPRKYDSFFPEVIKKNFGKWLYHEILEPGVLVHVAESGDKVYTVRCGGTRTMSVTNIREICEIADKYCDGHVRWTTRNNIEFMVTDEASHPEGPEGRPGGPQVRRRLLQVPHRRHRRRRFQHRAHPGLGALPHPRHRRLRPG